jgi:hypothetical protein
VISVFPRSGDFFSTHPEGGGGGSADVRGCRWLRCHAQRKKSRRACCAGLTAQRSAALFWTAELFGQVRAQRPHCKSILQNTQSSDERRSQQKLENSHTQEAAIEEADCKGRPLADAAQAPKGEARTATEIPNDKPLACQIQWRVEAR